MNATKGKRTAARKVRAGVSAARLAEMVEEATVDAYDESEQATGWFAMLEEPLELPFETEVLGVHVSVVGIEQRDDHRIVAICIRGRRGRRSRSPTCPFRRQSPKASSGSRRTDSGLAVGEMSRHDQPLPPDRAIGRRSLVW
jgi:hypothetical protein